jgi:pyruvate ferredoxin oxidoreductase alpha subunit
MMLARDTGWIQTVAENGQEVVDLLIHAYRVAEDHRVLLPVVVNFDGFIVSHVIEPIDLPTKEEVQRYLPPYKPLLRLDPRQPVTMGPVGVPEVYTELKKAQDEAFRNSKKVVIEAWEEFAKHFGRTYKPVETYKCDDADTIILAMGSISETAMRAVDAIRRKGKKVGLARIRLFRPFPVEELVSVLKPAKAVAVIDRSMGFNGHVGPVCAEVKTVLFDHGLNPYVWNFIAGLGGRDVTVENFMEMVNMTEQRAAKKEPMGYDIINVRE